MSEFRYNLSVDVHDVDFNGIAKTSSLMKYIQSAAQSQLSEVGLSYDNMKRQKRAFILSKIKMEFSEPIRAYDRLTAISFPCESRGFSFLRCYGLEKDGVTVGRAASIWALIDTDSKALVPVKSFSLSLDLMPHNNMMLERIIMPDNMEKVGTYTVNYADTDQNRHMNNTHYPDMYANFLPLENKRIKSMSIQYMSEAKMGERLTVERGFAGGLYFFRTFRMDGKINTLSAIELCDI